MSEIKVVCFGEVLMDQFPSGDKPGGAPMNVAYHLNNLGTAASLVSSIGKDSIGRELLTFMIARGIDTSLMQQHPNLESGTVQVDVSDKNEAKYTIKQPVAWDDIQGIPDGRHFEKIEYLIHGSLALRSKQNLETLRELKSRLHAKVVFDLNIRPPFYSKETIFELIQSSHILKVNKEEFQMIASWARVEPKPDCLPDLLSFFENLEMIVVTMGGDGALVQTKHELIRSRQFPSQVVDTVGAGDSFLGAFIHGLVQGTDLQTTINLAAATGALVASKVGANPDYSLSEIQS